MVQVQDGLGAGYLDREKSTEESVRRGVVFPAEDSNPAVLKSKKPTYICSIGGCPSGTTDIAVDENQIGDGSVFLKAKSVTHFLCLGQWFISLAGRC